MSATIKRRRAAKECARCGCKDSRTLSGKWFCIMCTKRQKTEIESFKNARKSRGLCVKCGEPLHENSRFITCFKCRLKESNRASKRKTVKKEVSE